MNKSFTIILVAISTIIIRQLSTPRLNLSIVDDNVYMINKWPY